MKAQASMEFITVYGFAIAIILGIVGVFAYLNVNPEQRVPNDCRFNVDIECVDFITSLSGDASIPINSGTTINIINKEEKLYEVSLKCYYQDGSETQGSAVQIIDEGEQATLNCPLPSSTLREGEKLRIDAEIMYHLNLTVMKNWRNYDGTIITTVRAGS